MIKPESKPIGEKSEIEQMKEEQDKRAMGMKEVSERKFNKEQQILEERRQEQKVERYEEPKREMPEI